MSFRPKGGAYFPTAMGKYVIPAMLATTLAVSSPTCVLAQAPGPRVSDSVVGIDKLKHFLMAGFVESVTFAGLQAVGTNRSASLAGAGAAAAVTSFGREFHDRRTKGLFSFGDLLWDALGAGAALLVLTKVHK